MDYSDFSHWQECRPGPYYVIQDAARGAPAHVIAEVVDWSQAEYNACAGSIFVSREEALAHPECRKAVEAWEARDYSARETWLQRLREALDLEKSAGIGLLEGWLAAQWEEIAAELEADADSATFKQQIAVARERHPSWTGLTDREIALLWAVEGLAAVRVHEAITGQDFEAMERRPMWDQLLSAARSIVQHARTC